MTSEKTRKRELGALVEASEELHCDNLLVITNFISEKEIVCKGLTIKIRYGNHF